MDTTHGTSPGETVHFHNVKHGVWVVEYAPGTPCPVRSESRSTIQETTRVVFFIEGVNGSSSGSVEAMVRIAKGTVRSLARAVRELAEANSSENLALNARINARIA